MCAFVYLYLCVYLRAYVCALAFISAHVICCVSVLRNLRVQSTQSVRICVTQFARMLLCVVEKQLEKSWSRGLDLNQRPPGYEPGELPDCSTPQRVCTRT